MKTQTTAKTVLTRWEKVTYDVWGNRDDGYEVNQAFRQELLAKWLSGESVQLPYNMPSAYLRVAIRSRCDPETGMFNPHDQIKEMQTSKGATVPLAEAEKAFRFVMLKRATGWHRNGDQFPIGEFHLDAVNEQGVVAGCHRVAWAEIERFAKTQGWI